MSRALTVPSHIESDGGQMIGEDPRRLSPADFSAVGIPLTRPAKAIRNKCLDCCGGDASEVRKCVSVKCPLWPMRMGNFPRKLRAALKPEDGEE